MTPLEEAKATLDAAAKDAADALGEMSSTWGTAPAREIVARAVIFALAKRGWTVERAE